MLGVWNFTFLIFSNKKQAAPNKAWTLRCSLGGTQTLNKSINSTQIPFQKLLRHPPHISRHHRTLKDAVRHQKTPTDSSKCHSMSTGAATHPWTAFWSAWDRLLVSFGVCWCLLLSRIVPRYVKEVIVIIWVKCMYVYRVWMNVREFLSVQALYVATNALYWKFFKRQNSAHLPVWKHQNTITSL